jgi:rhodanese-related sulfurtransferase
VEITRISPEEAQTDLESEEVTYLDVRSEPEFEQGHVPGAINIPIANKTPYGMQPNPDFLDQVKAALSTDAHIITGCLRGGRSLRAAQMLVAEGYTQVVDMRGGWDGELDPMGQVVYPGWARRGLPVSTD